MALVKNELAAEPEQSIRACEIEVVLEVDVAAPLAIDFISPHIGVHSDEITTEGEGIGIEKRACRLAGGEDRRARQSGQEQYRQEHSLRPTPGLGHFALSSGSHKVGGQLQSAESYLNSSHLADFIDQSVALRSGYRYGSR